MLGTWILILFSYAAPSRHVPAVLTSVPGFLTLATCQVAGHAAQRLAVDTSHYLRYTCVTQGR